MIFKFNVFLLTIALSLTPSISKINNNMPKYNIQDYKIIAELPKIIFPLGIGFIIIL